MCQITICQQKMEFLTDRTKKSQFVENLSKTSKQEENNAGLLAGGRSVKPSLVLYCSIIGHCTSLKNNTSVVKNDVSANHTCHKFLSDHNLAKCPIFENWVICRKFHSANFLAEMFLANGTDPH